MFDSLWNAGKACNRPILVSRDVLWDDRNVFLWFVNVTFLVSVVICVTKMETGRMKMSSWLSKPQPVSKEACARTDTHSHTYAHTRKHLEMYTDVCMFTTLHRALAGVRGILMSHIEFRKC